MSFIVYILLSTIITLIALYHLLLLLIPLKSPWQPFCRRRAAIIIQRGWKKHRLVMQTRKTNYSKHFILCTIFFIYYIYHYFDNLYRYIISSNDADMKNFDIRSI